MLPVNNRRDFLKTTGRAGLAAGLSITALSALAEKVERDALLKGIEGHPEEIPYEQRVLPYGYTVLEPVIDAMTMEIHYSKHASA